MVFLLDNDIALKIACLDLVDLYVELCRESNASVFCLPTLLIQLQRSKKWRDRYGDATIGRAAAMVRDFNELNQPPDSDTLALLHTIPEIDAGEAVLFASAPCFPEFIIQTGDKRCLVALAESAVLPDDFIERYREKVQCFEQVLLAMIHRFDFERISASVKANKNCDTVADIVSGAAVRANRENAMQGLMSYIRDLRQRSGGFLCNTLN